MDMCRPIGIKGVPAVLHWVSIFLLLHNKSMQSCREPVLPEMRHKGKLALVPVQTSMIFMSAGSSSSSHCLQMFPSCSGWWSCLREITCVKSNLSTRETPTLRSPSTTRCQISATNCIHLQSTSNPASPLLPPSLTCLNSWMSFSQGWRTSENTPWWSWWWWVEKSSWQRMLSQQRCSLCGPF